MIYRIVGGCLSKNDLVILNADEDMEKFTIPIMYRLGKNLLNEMIFESIITLCLRN